MEVPQSVKRQLFIENINYEIYIYMFNYTLV